MYTPDLNQRLGHDTDVRAGKEQASLNQVSSYMLRTYMNAYAWFPGWPLAAAGCVMGREAWLGPKKLDKPSRPSRPPRAARGGLCTELAGLQDHPIHTNVNSRVMVCGEENMGVCPTHHQLILPLESPAKAGISTAE